MKKIKLILFLLSITLTFVRCSKDSPETPIGLPSFNTISIVTKQAVLSNNNLSITTGGIISSDFNNSDFYSVGVCYADIPNVSILNQTLSLNFNSNSLNFNNVINNISFGNTYYMKAFVRNNSTNEIKYGNEVSITIPLSLTTDIVKNISCSGFSVNVNVSTILSSNTSRGICYSTSQNPTVSNQTFEDVTFGSGTFTLIVNNPFPNYYVSPNTIYYLKSFIKINNTYYYGNQVTFKTAGYIGGSGGYVYFDKGEMTNNWRYLEAASNNLIYNNNVNWFFTWNNCNSTLFLAGLSNDIGTGLENSIILKNNCNFTDNAAAMARYISLNGTNDWFLPSIEELKQLYKLKKENIISYIGSYPLISSSQVSNNTNFGVDFSSGVQVSMLKTEAGRVWQTRRF